MREDPNDYQLLIMLLSVIRRWVDQRTIHDLIRLMNDWNGSVCTGKIFTEYFHGAAYDRILHASDIQSVLLNVDLNEAIWDHNLITFEVITTEKGYDEIHYTITKELLDIAKEFEEYFGKHPKVKEMFKKLKELVEKREEYKQHFRLKRLLDSLAQSKEIMEEINEKAR